MALHQDMPSHLHLPGCQTLTTSQNTHLNTIQQPKVVNGLAPHQTQKLQMALHEDMPSHLHLPGRQTFTTSKYLAQYSMTTKGCNWLGTTSNSGAADGLASRYAKPSAPTRPPNIHNLQNTWPNTAWQPKVVNGLAPHQTQEPQMALHQDMPSHLHLPGRQTFTTSKYLAHYSMTTKGCKWLGTTSNSEAADGLASRYAKPSAPTRPPNIHNLQILIAIQYNHQRL